MRLSLFNRFGIGEKMLINVRYDKFRNYIETLNFYKLN